MGLSLQAAVARARSGAKIRFGQWSITDPDFLVFVAGRDVIASFPPMANILGEGTPFRSEDHMDAVRLTVYDGKIQNAVVTLGYQFSQHEIMTAEWEEVF